jgi:hypothetical protein
MWCDVMKEDNTISEITKKHYSQLLTGKKKKTGETISAGTSTDASW